MAYQLKGGVNSTRPRRKIRLAVTRLVGASFRRLRRRRRQAPAPAASSAKCAVPRPQILTRIAVIEHIMRAVSAPAAPAHHTCCFCPCCACRCRRCPQRSAFVVASRPERCCEPEPRRAAPHRTRVSFTLFSLGKWSEALMPQQPVQELYGGLEALTCASSVPT